MNIEESTLLGLFENLSVGVCATNLDGQVFMWNKYLTTLTGVDHDDALGKKLDQLLPFPETLDYQHEIHRLELEHKQQIFIDLEASNLYIIIQKDPEHQDQVFHTIIKKGHFTNFLENEDASIPSGDVLLQSRLLLKLADSVPDTIYFKNLNSEILFANKAFLAKFNLNELRDLQGKTDFDIFDFDLASKKFADEQEVIKTGKGIINKQEYDIVNGNKKWMLTSKLPLYDHQGKIIGTLGISRDVTTKVETEIALKQRNDELNQFVYHISHDLRAPLTTIKGLLKLIENASEEEKEKYISLFSTRIERLDIVIKNILSHSLNLNTELKIEMIDLPQVIDESIIKVLDAKGKQKINFSRDIDEVVFCSDFERIKEVITGLLSNAISFTKPKQDVNIKIIVREKNDHVHIHISDNGIGIMDELKPKIFKMFIRGDHEKSGSGIGLYIIRNIVKKLGGEINFESRINVGSTFSISFPKRYNKKEY